jgi:alpha-1,3-mannosyltransferase
MAGKQKPHYHVALYRQVKSLALGEHPLSKYVPPLLLLADALLTSLIISKVACKSSFEGIVGGWS